MEYDVNVEVSGKENNAAAMEPGAMITKVSESRTVAAHTQDGSESLSHETEPASPT